MLGVIPAYILGRILKAAGVLRSPREIEIIGLDFGLNNESKEFANEILAAEQEALSAAGLTKN